MFPWPFGKSKTVTRSRRAAPEIGAPAFASSSHVVTDRVTARLQGRTNPVNARFDLVDRFGGLQGDAGLTGGAVTDLAETFRSAGVSYLHLSSSTVVQEIQKLGVITGGGLDGNPYAQQASHDHANRLFDADSSPVFISTERLGEAAPWFSSMGATQAGSEFPIVLGLKDYPVRGQNGLTHASPAAIERSHLGLVCAPEAQAASVREHLANSGIDVISWPKAAVSGETVRFRAGAEALEMRWGEALGKFFV